MPKITPETKERLGQIEREIVDHWNTAEDEHDLAISHANSAVIAAWHVGKLLIETKALIGHGHFGEWKQQMQIPDVTAFRYMKLASNFPLLENLPENKREAYLAIGLLPTKDGVEHEGNVALQANANYFSVINRFHGWISRVESGKQPIEDIDKARRDFQPLYDFLRTKIYENN